MTDKQQPSALCIAELLDAVPETGADPQTIQDAAGSWVRYADHLAALAAEQATAGAALPAGWVPLTITYEGQYPEEVAYGPKIMMDRLGKWLGKFFAYVATPTAQDSMQEDAIAVLRADLKASAKEIADEYAKDAARWRWLAEYLVGTRTDLDEEIVACETAATLGQLVDAARAEQEGK